MSDRTAVPYPNSGGTVWNSYANQPAAQKVRVSDAQSQFGVSGSGIVADIDTGVDPTHPALQDRKSTRLNSSHLVISYAVFCLKKKTTTIAGTPLPSPSLCRDL